MAVAIAVVPGKIMLIWDISGGDALQHGWKIALQPRLVFNCCDSPRGAHIEHCDDAILHARAVEYLFQLWSDVHHLEFCGLAQGDFVTEYGHFISLR